MWDLKYETGGHIVPALSPIPTLFGHDLCNLCHLFLATVHDILSKVYLSQVNVLAPRLIPICRYFIQYQRVSRLSM